MAETMYHPGMAANLSGWESEQRKNEERKRKAIAVAEGRRALAESREAEGTTVFDVFGRFNKGLLDLITLPTNLVNAGIGIMEYPFRESISLPRIAGVRELEEWAHRTGFTPDPETPAEGVLEHAAEFLGASALPVGGLFVKGYKVLNRADKGLKQLGLLDHLALATAEHPKIALAGELVSSLSAAGAGERARESEFVRNSANSDTYIVMAELLGAFTPAAIVTAAGKFNIPRAIVNNIRKNLLPMTKYGARPRAVDRLQALVADPQAVAEKIDPKKMLSAARQIGEKRLLALEEAVLKADPVLAKEYEDTLKLITASLVEDTSSFSPANVERARALLRDHVDYLINLVNVNAAKTAKKSADAIAKLKPNATERKLSTTVKDIVKTSYRVVRDTEKQLWRVLNSIAPAGYENIRSTLKTILADRSYVDDPKQIPAWIHKKLARKAPVSDAVMKDLKDKGLLEKDGSIGEALMGALKKAGLIKPERQITFNDLKAFRSRLLRDIDRELSKASPDRNKMRILNWLANGNADEGVKGLLDDMENSMILLGGDALKEYRSARAFSDQLNARFVEGNVGRLMGFEASGAQRITDETTLAYLLRTGDTQDPVANIKQLIAAVRMSDSPEIRPLVEDHIKAMFLSNAMNEKGFATENASKFISDWARKGLFDEDVFPELRAQLEGVKNLEQGAKRLGIREDRVRKVAHQASKSRATFYLDQPVGEEMKYLLNSEDSVRIAGSLVAKIKKTAQRLNDPSDGVRAINGLKASFVEELFRRAGSGAFMDDQTPIISGNNFTRLINEYTSTAKALNFTDAEIANLKKTASILRKVEAKPGGEEKIMPDLPGTVMEFLATYIGASRFGSLSKTLGSGMVLAQWGAKWGRAILGKLTADTAKQLVIAAHQNTPEGRALYKALMSESPAQEEIGAVMVDKFLTRLGRRAIGVSVSEIADLEQDRGQNVPSFDSRAALFAPSTLITP